MRGMQQRRVSLGRAGSNGQQQILAYWVAQPQQGLCLKVPGSRWVISLLGTYISPTIFILLLIKKKY